MGLAEILGFAHNDVLLRALGHVIGTEHGSFRGPTTSVGSSCSSGDGGA